MLVTTFVSGRMQFPGRQRIATFAAALRKLDATQILRLGVKSEIMALGTGVHGDRLLRMAIDHEMLTRAKHSDDLSIEAVMCNTINRLAALERERRRIDVDVFYNPTFDFGFTDFDLTGDTTYSATAEITVECLMDEIAGHLRTLPCVQKADIGKPFDLASLDDDEFENVLSTDSHTLKNRFCVVIVLRSRESWSSVICRGDAVSQRLVRVAEWLVSDLDSLSVNAITREAASTSRTVQNTIYPSMYSHSLQQAVFDAQRLLAALNTKTARATLSGRALLNTRWQMRQFACNDDLLHSAHTLESQYSEILGSIIDACLQRRIDDGTIDGHDNTPA